ncbi:MAG: AAA family ATPase [Polyangiaceae bacterium]
MPSHVLRLEELAVREVRNLRRVDLSPAPRVNVIAGNNGQGKTSLLEAIYLVATSRSFRTSALAEVGQHGAEAASVRARFVEVPVFDLEDGGAGAVDTETAWHRGEPVRREQVVGLAAGRSTLRIDGNRPRSMAEFAVRSPVVAFHPDELELSSGPAARRRILLDRLALFVEPQSADHRARYGKALRARQQLLKTGRAGDGAEPGADVEAFEALCATHGAALTRARARAAAMLALELVPIFARIAAPGLRLDASYRPGGSDDEATARDELARHRARDRHRPSAGFGPHRDDLHLALDGHPARIVASQGQHRALTLALKAAETACIASVRGVEPIQLLDDVSSELDADRTRALFEFLASRRGQLFLTTTRPDLIVTPGIGPSERRDFVVEEGSIRPASAPP